MSLTTITLTPKRATRVKLTVQNANEFILTIDCDLLIHPDDMKKILAAEDEFVGVTKRGTNKPVHTEIDGKMVTAFYRQHGLFEWAGVT